jgi:hypothetical protein
MYIVAILNEGSVKHYAEHIRGFVVKHDLGIAAHRERHFLVVCESKNDRLVFISCVSLWGGVSECLCNAHAVAMENFEKWRACISAHIGNLVELDTSKSLDCGWFYNFFVEALEVVNIPELTGLADTFAAREPPLTVELQGIVNIIKKATKK